MKNNDLSINEENNNGERISIKEAKNEIENLINMSDMTEQQKTIIMKSLNYMNSGENKEDEK